MCFPPHFVVNGEDNEVTCYVESVDTRLNAVLIYDEGSKTKRKNPNRREHCEYLYSKLKYVRMYIKNRIFLIDESETYFYFNLMNVKEELNGARFQCRVRWRLGMAVYESYSRISNFTVHCKFSQKKKLFSNNAIARISKILQLQNVLTNHCIAAISHNRDHLLARL